MRTIKFNQRELALAMKAVGKILSKKAVNQILMNVLMSMGKEEVTFWVSDASCGMKVRVSAQMSAGEEGESEVMVEGRILLETVGVFSGELTQMKIEGEEVVVENGRDRVRMKCVGVSDWPKWGEGKEEEMVKCGRWMMEKMGRIVGLTSGATGTDIVRPQLMGILLQQQEDGEVMMVGTDGFRLAMVKENEMWQPTEENKAMLIMVKDWQNVLFIGEVYEEKEWQVQKDPQKGWLIWKSESIEYWNSLLDEEKYPPWQKIVPLEFTQEIKFSSEEMRETLGKAQVFVKDNTNVGQWKIGEEKIEVMAQGILGQYKGEVELKEKSEEEIDISFNLRYMSDFLSKTEGKEVWMGMNGNLKPVMLKVQGDKNFSYIIMPFKQK